MNNLSKEFYEIKGARGFKNIARALARLEILRRPVFASHADFEIEKLKSILRRHPYNLHAAREIYRFFIKDLRTGRLREIVNYLQPYRERLGYALPMATENLVRGMAGMSGEKIILETAATADVKNLVYGRNWLSGGAILKINSPSIHVTTGFGRNIKIPATLKDLWRGGEYVEIGGSLGALAYEIKNIIGFRECYSLDIMTQAQAAAIKTIVDFKAKKPVIVTGDLREKFEKEINFIWKYDVLETPLAELKLEFRGAPAVIGIHNIVDYYIDKEKVIFNAISGLPSGGYLWISSYGRPYNMIMAIEAETIKEAIYF